jgi:translation initiation factor 1
MSETCTICGLPKELCVCKEITKSGEKISIFLERKKRRKFSTIIVGFDSSADLKELTKELKRKLACGGTFKDRKIELQGDHRGKVRGFLLSRNYNEDQIDVK